MGKLFLIRHGTTDATDLGLACGTSDGGLFSLNLRGEEESRKAGTIVMQNLSSEEKSKGVVIITGPTSRLLDTANIVSEQLNKESCKTETIVNSKLIGKNYGLIEGKLQKDIKTFKKPELTFAYLFWPYRIGAQSKKEYAEQIDTGLDDIKEYFDGRTVVLVLNSDALKYFCGSPVYCDRFGITNKDKFECGECRVMTYKENTKTSTSQA